MILIFVTGDKNAAVFDEICKEENIFVNKIKNNQDIKRLVINNMANFNHCKYFAVDLSAVRNTDGEIIEALQAYSAMYHGNLIIVAIGHSADDSLLIRLRENGFTNIITEPSTENIKAALYEQTQAPPIPIVPPPSPSMPKIRTIVQEKVVIKRLKQHVTISICGSQSRIGTTTQALLLAKFLRNMDAKVCYVELSKNRHISAMAKVYQMNENPERGFVQMEGIDMFYKYDLGYIVSCGYEFIILDWGVFDGSFTQNYITSDVKIVTAGAKAWEMQYLSAVFEGLGEMSGINFIFSFTAPDEQSYIVDMMGKFKDTTYFSEYAPAIMENGKNKEAFSRLLGDYLQMDTAAQIEETKEVGKNGLLGRLLRK